MPESDDGIAPLQHDGLSRSGRAACYGITCRAASRLSSHLLLVAVILLLLLFPPPSDSCWCVRSVRVSPLEGGGPCSMGVCMANWSGSEDGYRKDAGTRQLSGLNIEMLMKQGQYRWHDPKHTKK